MERYCGVCDGDWDLGDETVTMAWCDVCGAETPLMSREIVPASRMALLRGYGNAIVPPLAAVFVRAAAEAIAACN